MPAMSLHFNGRKGWVADDWRIRPGTRCGLKRIENSVSSGPERDRVQLQIEWYLAGFEQRDRLFKNMDGKDFSFLRC